MASRPPLTHLFAELSSLEDLKNPLKGSSRLRYTCMNVSQQYIALGSNTGCVYVFGRDSLKHVKSVYGDTDSKPVTVVAISPNELNVALAVTSGHVIVMEMNIERRSKPERIRHTTDHQDATVTTMVWGSTGASLFVGDSLGKVTQINVPGTKAKTMFAQPSQTIVRLECSITQLDWWGSKLLASSLSRAYLLNTAKQQFSQIGKKPREGEFGACFFLEPSSNYPVIYSARPGSRIWEVDFEGNVLNTHQFKQLLATQPMPIITAGVDFSQLLHIDPPCSQSVSFQRMFRIREFILTWSSKGLYIFDPINVRVVLWTDSITSATIQDICVVKNEVYIFFESQQVRRLLFLPILHLCAALVTSHRCLLAAELVLFLEHFTVKPSLLKHIKKELLPQLVVFLKEAGRTDVVESIQAMMEDVSESSLDSVSLPDEVTDSSLFPAYTTQNSGIVVVNDGCTGFGDTERRGRWSNRSSPVDSLSHLHNENLKSSRMASPESIVSKTERRSSTSSSVSSMSDIERNNNQQSELKAAPESPDFSLKTSTNNTFERDTYDTTNDALYTSASSVIDTSLKEACDTSTGEISETSERDASERDVSDISAKGSFVTSKSDISGNESAGASVKDTSDTSGKDTFDNSAKETSDTFTRDTSSQNTSDFSDGEHLLIDTSNSFTDNSSLNKSGEEGEISSKVSVSSPEVLKVESREACSLQHSGEAENDGKDSLSDGRSSMVATSPHPTTQPVEPEDTEDVVCTDTVDVLKTQPVRTGDITASSTPPAAQILEADSRAETISLSYSPPNGMCHSAENRDETELKLSNENRLSFSQHVYPGQDFDPGELQETKPDLTEFAKNVSGAGVSTMQYDGECELQSRTEDAGGLRKIHSMPSMTTEEEIDQTDASDRKVKDAEPLPWSPVNSAQRNSSDISTDVVVRTTKKKKRRVVNEVDIPLAGSTSGQQHRSESTGAQKQKKTKKKDSHPRARSVDSAIDHSHHEFLQHSAPDPDAVSLTTIGSIEEEERAGAETDDVFISTTHSKRDDNIAAKVTASNPELFETSTAASEEEHSTDTSLSNSYDNSSQPVPNSQDDEVIPPLIERLSALGVSRVAAAGSEDAGRNSHDPATSVKNIITVASKQKIASVKERVTKISSTTRSLIRRVAEKNPLVSRSPSESPPSGAPIHSHLSHSPSPKDETGTSSNSNVLLRDKPSLPFPGTDLSTSTFCIDLEPFLLFTEETLKQMKEHSVLLNPGELKAVLNAWAAQLNHTLVAFHRENYRQQKLQNAKEGAKEETDIAIRMGNGYTHSSLQNPEKETLKTDDIDHEHADSTSGNNLDLSDSQETCSAVPSSDHGNEQVSHSTDSAGLTDCYNHHSSSDSSSPNTSALVQSACDPSPVSTPSGISSNGLDSNTRSDDHEETSTPENAVPEPESDSSEKSDLHVEQKSTKSNCNKSTESHIKQKSIDTDTATGFVNKNSSDEDDSFCCDWSQVCHIKDPFQLSMKQHKLVSSLAFHCLECGCFGNATNVFSTSLAGPKTVSAKLQASVTVPSSYGSFSNADSSSLAASSVDRLLHQKSDTLCSSDSQSLHPTTPESQSNAATVGSEDDVNTESETVAAQKNSVSVCESLQHSTEVDKSSDQHHLHHQHDSQCQNNNHVSEKDNSDGDIERFDQERALFVHLYFHFLPYWRLRRLLLEADGKTVYATWCAVIACHQAQGYGDIVWTKINSKDITGAMDYLRSGILPNKHAFMGHVASLFGLRPTLVTEFSAEVPHQVRLSDILHLCHLHSTPQHQVISRYLTLRLGSMSSHGRYELLKQMCTNQHTKLAVLDCLIRLHFCYISSATSSTSVSSDVRLKASADNSRLTPEAVSESLTCVLSLIQRNENSAALEICWQHGYWPGCLLLLKQTDQWQRALQLEVRLNDITLLNGVNSFGFTPRNVNEWKYLLHLLAQSPALSPVHHHQSQDGETDVVDSGTTSENQLSWMSLGLLAAQHLGPKTAIELLQSCSSDDVSDICLSAEFYNTCLTLAALERKQKLLVHNMLDKVDSYLWAKKPVHINPQVYYAATEERSALQSSNTEDMHFYHNLFARLSAAPVTEKQLAEDPDCHWGVKVNIERVCEVCQVLVTDTVSHLQPGVFIFKCGHVFHKFCVPDKLCPFC